jgi:transcriptional regulator NrdR family protein
MLFCPNCGTRTGVYDTRISFDGQLRRKRLCGKCGHRYATIEVLDNKRGLIRQKKVKEVKPVKPKAPVQKKAQVVKKETNKLGEIDYFESSLDEDFRDVARELGIRGFE